MATSAEVAEEDLATEMPMLFGSSAAAAEKPVVVRVETVVKRRPSKLKTTRMSMVTSDKTLTPLREIRQDGNCLEDIPDAMERENGAAARGDGVDGDKGEIANARIHDEMEVALNQNPLPQSSKVPEFDQNITEGREIGRSSSCHSVFYNNSSNNNNNNNNNSNSSNLNVIRARHSLEVPGRHVGWRNTFTGATSISIGATRQARKSLHRRTRVDSDVQGSNAATSEVNFWWKRMATPKRKSLASTTMTSTTTIPTTTTDKSIASTEMESVSTMASWDVKLDEDADGWLE